VTGTNGDDAEDDAHLRTGLGALQVDKNSLLRQRDRQKSAQGWFGKGGLGGLAVGGAMIVAGTTGAAVVVAVSVAALGWWWFLQWDIRCTDDDIRAVELESVLVDEAARGGERGETRDAHMALSAGVLAAGGSRGPDDEEGGS
jgi:hypothetical protein